MNFVSVLITKPDDIWQLKGQTILSTNCQFTDSLKYVLNTHIASFPLCIQLITSANVVSWYFLALIIIYHPQQIYFFIFCYLLTYSVYKVLLCYCSQWNETFQLLEKNITEQKRDRYGHVLCLSSFFDWVKAYKILPN